MNYEKHEAFLNDLAKAYTESNADYILPWLADDEEISYVVKELCNQI